MNIYYIDTNTGEDDKSCVMKSRKSDGFFNNYNNGLSAVAFSNNILRAGKHYASFVYDRGHGVNVGVMRPGQANKYAVGVPLYNGFYFNFSQRLSKIQRQQQ